MTKENVSARVPLLSRLIKSLSKLPGIGEKSAQRIAFSLLARKRKEGLDLSLVLKESMVHLKHCDRCRNFSEQEICSICDDPLRESSQICVVEMPSDLYALEQTQQFKGRYFVLFGHLSPIDGILPKNLGLDRLKNIFEISPEINEIILATNSTVEGEITAQYIAEMARNYKIRCNRIACGIPMGAELEYMDRLTLSYALLGRQPMKSLNS